MSFSLSGMRDARYVVERSSVVSPSMKRDFNMINKNGIRYVIKETSPSDTRSEDVKVKKSKKFRAEWMEEEHLKDWLQPYPVDDTMCICTACGVVLRCGKSEIEKHASGLKHTKKLEEMKVDSPQDSENSQSQAQVNDQDQPPARFVQFLGRTGSQVWISHAALPVDDEVEEVIEENEAVGFTRPQQEEKSSCDAKLTEALVKLFEFADGKVDLSRKRLEMLQEEHALKLQILEKELHLKTLEVEIKETELKKLKLDTMQSGVKESQIPQNTQVTFSDHQLHVISDQHLQEALQAQLQQFQNQFEHHQSQEPKVKGDLTT